MIEDDFSFTIYRPEKPTGRLEGAYFQGDQKYWRPSLSYKHTIDDIRNQFTPAENFRHALATSGKYIRMIQRLEIRWNRNYNAFVHAATKIQSLYRGNVSRAHYELIKQELIVELKRRQAMTAASAFFVAGSYNDAIDEVNRNLPGTTQLLAIKMKAQYRLNLHDECIATSQEIIDVDPLQEEPYYIQACSWLRLSNPDKAYHTMKGATIQIDAPSRDTLCLCAFIAVRIVPPRYMEGVDSLSAVLKNTPNDFDARVDRAGCLLCLQEWEAGIKDLTYVIVFVPTHRRALLLRARAYACIREWSLARADYTSVRMHYPSCLEAQKGLEDIQDTVIVLPMLGDNLLDNESA